MSRGQQEQQEQQQQQQHIIDSLSAIFSVLFIIVPVLFLQQFRKHVFPQLLVQ